MNRNKERKVEPKVESRGDINPDGISEEEADFDFKARVECICPSCGKRHFMNFHWIGRGVPRKFCKNCRSSE